MNWIKTTDLLPQDGVVVKTKIEDENGVRNEQNLQKKGNLWWTADGAMYIYYSPTHWKSL